MPAQLLSTTASVGTKQTRLRATSAWLGAKPAFARNKDGVAFSQDCLPRSEAHEAPHRGSLRRNRRAPPSCRGAPQPGPRRAELLTTRAHRVTRTASLETTRARLFARLASHGASRAKHFTPSAPPETRRAAHKTRSSPAAARLVTPRAASASASPSRTPAKAPTRSSPAPMKPCIAPSNIDATKSSRSKARPHYDTLSLPHF